MDIAIRTYHYGVVVVVLVLVVVGGVQIYMMQMMILDNSPMETITA